MDNFGENYIELAGTVEEVIYTNDENGYTVCQISSDKDDTNELIICVGYMPYLSAGETVVFRGNFTNHIEYGEQFKVSYFEKEMPKTDEGLLKYLGSGVIKGIKEATAQRIMETFGADTIKVITTCPEKLATIKGISRKKAFEISESYAQQQNAQSLVMFLQKYGVSPTVASRVHKIYGSLAQETLKENPYVLSECVSSIGFKTADRIALNMGIDTNSSVRIKACVMYVIKTNAYSQGHTFVLHDYVVKSIMNMISVSDIDVENAIFNLLMEKKLCTEDINVNEIVNLPESYQVCANEDGKLSILYIALLYHSERIIANRLTSLRNHPFDDIFIDDIEEDIEDIERENSITLAQRQKDAVVGSAQNGLVVITGGPGTGKTTTINAIIKIFEKRDLRVILAAPTGRAAKRMSQLCGIEAKTIHRLLEMTFSNDDNKEHLAFGRNEENPLEADVLIVDEMSMVDTLLASSLLRALKDGTRLIMVGDADQLASVGAGNILDDIIKSKSVKVIYLNEIFRQAEKSMIIVNAHRINTGQMPIVNESGKEFFFIARSNANAITQTIVELCKNRIPKKYKLNPIVDVQVISPMRKGFCGSMGLNIALQNALNPPSQHRNEKKFGDKTFRLGDKVMQLKNNYDIQWKKVVSSEDGTGIFNGDIGFVTDVEQSSMRIEVTFDDDKVVWFNSDNIEQLEHAYAVTVHKSQGSEFKMVIMPIFNAPLPLMTRNLFYTAVTRAKDTIILVGNPEAMQVMVNNNVENKRNTGLVRKLKSLNNDKEIIE